MYLKRTSISFFTWFYGIAYIIYLAAVFCRLIFTLWTPDEVFTQSFRDGIPLTSTDDKYIISNDTVQEMYLNFYGKNQTLKRKGTAADSRQFPIQIYLSLLLERNVSKLLCP